MGTWGTGGFDNDTAGDWLDQLLEDDGTLIADALLSRVVRV